MNKKIIVVLIALATVFSYAKGKGREDTRKVKEETMSFGARAGFVINSFLSGNEDFDKDIKIGLGGGVGGVLNYPITDIFVFSPEVGIYYRTLYNVKRESSKNSVSGDITTQDECISEVAISIPLMIQVAPFSVPFHLAAGVQIDFPFSSEAIMIQDGIDETTHMEIEDVTYGGTRKALDFGIALGLGYRVMPNLGIDLRGVIGLTSLIDSDKFEDGKLKQYGIGVSYFF